MITCCSIMIGGLLVVSDKRKSLYVPSFEGFGVILRLSFDGIQVKKLRVGSFFTMVIG